MTQSTLSLWLKAAGRVSVVRETSPQWIDRVRRQPVWAESRHRDDHIDDPLDLAQSGRVFFRWLDRVRRRPERVATRHRNDHVDDPLDLVPNHVHVTSADPSRSTLTSTYRSSGSRQPPADFSAKQVEFACGDSIKQGSTWLHDEVPRTSTSRRRCRRRAGMKSTPASMARVAL